MKPRDLLAAGEDLLSGKTRPREANLRRAVSTAYYAVFHTLAKCCADLLIGGHASDRSKPAWQQVYRSLEHGVAKKACENDQKIEQFPKEIQDFATAFLALHKKREDADYNPNQRFYKSSCLVDLNYARSVIEDFERVPTKDKRAFAVLVLFKAPRKT